MKSQHLDDKIMSSAARLRARVLAILHGALDVSSVDQATIARTLGVRKSAVGAVFHGNGNVRIDTLAEYLAAMGFEADITAVPLGEIDSARHERRAPKHVGLTLADADRANLVHLPENYELVAVRQDHTRRLIVAAWQNKERGAWEEIEDTREMAPSELPRPRRYSPAENYARKVAVP